MCLFVVTLIVRRDGEIGQFRARALTVSIAAILLDASVGMRIRMVAQSPTDAGRLQPGYERPLKSLKYN